MIILSCGRFDLVFLSAFIVSYIIDTRYDSQLIYVAVIDDSIVRVGEEFRFDLHEHSAYGVEYVNLL